MRDFLLFLLAVVCTVIRRDGWGPGGPTREEIATPEELDLWAVSTDREVTLG